MGHWWCGVIVMGVGAVAEAEAEVLCRQAFLLLAKPRPTENR
jgi:hypothetical protein